MSENNGSYFKGLFIGGLIGAIIGILYAPKSGRETREELTRKADELLSKAKEEYEKNKEDYEAVFKRVQDVGSSIKGKASNVEEKISKFAQASKETVQLLLSAGAEINAKSEEGDTPLNVACRYRRKNKGGVIDLLHKNGAVRRHGKNNSYEYEPDLIGMWP